MKTTVELSDELITEACHHGNAHSRSTPGQIEHWCRIGKIAEENPDLPYGFIRDILHAREEVSIPFTFGEE
uniref:ParD-like antitoxin of type II toxin-antitoxin system n=1 Tax=Candidatus Kentrum sp. FM TaxID=2126340 RepID=A0A450S9G4_9GAMM|nr:MAG: ParD-like antitoxin of type II toxin-antitoxin system [Candidatus Kentron sp. FM]VFJ48702.1 MAG: ParD-like antitoxin of type II toxin-antitoxin system [Candidatus Kentron sp. FM]VFK07586.1 MAG: ParD-like antitoxin of type II toxin-antitoxin system [Candidatus Kentron sp. FM]